MLSEDFASQSEAKPQSKHPYQFPAAYPPSIPRPISPIHSPSGPVNPNPLHPPPPSGSLFKGFPLDARPRSRVDFHKQFKTTRIDLPCGHLPSAI
jgi:hypothetical protein